MILSKTICKSIAFLLVVTMSFASINNTQVVFAQSYEYVMVELTADEMDDFLERFMSEFSLLHYSGDSRIVNNVKFVYENGRLRYIVDAWENQVAISMESFDVEATSNSAELRFDDNIIDFKLGEHGFVSYSVRGTERGSQYFRNEQGDITQIVSYGMEMEISISQDGANAIVNNQFKLPLSILEKIVPDIQCFTQHEANTGSLHATLSFDSEERIARIDYSNDMVLLASYDEFGFSSTSLLLPTEDGLTLNLETYITPITTQVGELTRLDEIVLYSNGKTSRYVMNEFGLIGSIYRNGILTIEYTYDRLTGQLLSVNDHAQNLQSSYEFDYHGNMLSRTVSTPYGIEVFRHDYENPLWRDQLTFFDENPITHDAEGNITNMLGMALDWENGLLKRVYNGNTVASFEYNERGRRTSMNVDGVKTTFVIDDFGRIVSEYSCDGQVIEYMFDNENNLVGFIVDGEQFFYQRNFLGDIVGILDSELNLVVEYFYDSWGNILEIRGSKADTIGRINPFRYRGHRFDESTGLYYISGRFYSPVISRFISPSQDIGAKGNSISHNMYAFALNNPVMNVYGVSPFSGTLKLIIPWMNFAILFITIMFTIWYAVWQLEQALWHIGNETRILSNTAGMSAFTFGEIVAESLQQAITNWSSSNRSNMHNHHIVARSDIRAARSQRIFLPHFRNNIDHYINVVPLRASLHSRLHTSLYHHWVEVLLIGVNGGTDNYQPVHFFRIYYTMVGMRNVLRTASIAAP